MSPLRELKEAEDSLQEAKRAAATATANVAELEKRANDVRLRVNAARSLALLSIKPRRLVTAYALWLLTPFIWPGAYLFYLGRDVHAVLHTISFGGFGVGWLLDAFYIPLYVADHNEPPGYVERVMAKRRGCLGQCLSLLLSPLFLALQMALALYVGSVAAYLVPRPLVLPEELGLPPFSRVSSAAIGFCFGMLSVAVCTKLTSTRLGRTRTATSWKPILLVASLCSAVLSPNVVDLSAKHGADGSSSADELLHMPGLFLGALAVMAGAAKGRVTDIERSPRKCTSRRLSLRLLLQVVGVCSFAGAALGSFYLNGSYTYTEQESGVTKTMHGPEALKEAYTTIRTLTSDVRTATSMLWERQRHKTWSEMLGELREAFRDPAVEAAELLGVSPDAPLEEIKRAHRNLARKHHPDKVGEDPQLQEAAKQLMQRLNWAKETLAAKR